MSLNAALIEVLVAKGMSAQDILDVARASERRADPTATERKRRQRAKSRRDVTRDPPNDNILTPGVSSSDETQLAERDPFPKPEWAEVQLWADFLKNRRKKKAPNTATAYAGFLADIDRLTDDEWPPPRLLRHATAKGWAGIYDPRSKPHDRPTASNDEIQNPYARAVTRRQAERAAAER